MLHKLGYEYTCENCEEPKTLEDMSSHDNDWCIDCQDEFETREDAYWKPLYDGERVAGLLSPGHK